MISPATTWEEYQQMEKIGQASLPIYYLANDLWLNSLDRSQIQLKATCSNSSAIIGFIVAEKQENGARLHIKSIAVDPESRKQGIGRALIDYLKNNFPFLSITLYVSEENSGGQIFYLKQGFRPIKKLLNYYQTLNQSAYLMCYQKPNN